ncbi:MAG TPA: hypothetical protein VGR02_14220 [Thermoanaerobaculia bacterium]|jgi:hypothetical protein|nr:hypothetical protein [Thermoanaerobaculia bacterium]
MTQTSALGRAASTVTGAIKRVFSHHHHDDNSAAESTPRQAAPAERTGATKQQARPVQRQTDIPLPILDDTYTPPQTSLKAGFRADGSDRQRDQELTPETADDRWNDEDRFTNKTGNPRIGTHGRTYEPGEEARRR